MALIRILGSEDVTGSGGGDKNFRFPPVGDFGPSATWAITHGLDKYPSVTVFTSAGDQVEGEVVHYSINQLAITFSAGFMGHAYLN